MSIKRVQVGLRLQPGLHQQVRSAATMSDRSINAEIEARLWDSFLADRLESLEVKIDELLQRSEPGR